MVVVVDAAWRVDPLALQAAVATLRTTTQPPPAPDATACQPCDDGPTLPSGGGGGGGGGGGARVAVAAAGTLPAPLRLAHEAELVALFGWPRGYIGPLGLHDAASCSVVVDRALRGRRLRVGAGLLHVVELSADALIEAAGATVADVAGRLVPTAAEAAQTSLPEEPIL